ncbi:asparagine synthase (glutamine-hydrolysing) [Alkalispirillum mobile]|uniref:asparagine synthase (glutamine-hydrolyzing) n=1 Tax=Alkalispirillum mobile TaxID=85925 RepID=A0A498C6W3_9GAMM|nr:asparagine synthase-related protein [Alkalispirillum mobile]RLK51625.1 asparagine synthase (glutamine-hydrolysing) [Alkalispirillum mobile]
MAGLCGWLSTGGGQDGRDIRERAESLAARHGAGTQHRANPRAACLVRDGWLVEDDQGRIAALVGHPFWRDRELAEYAAAKDHARALLHAWQQYGAGLFDRLGGDFALVVIDTAQGRVLAGVDRIGQQPLHYARIPGGVVFGSTADSVLAHPGLSRTPTAEGLYHYLFFHMLPAPVSLFPGLAKLQGAHCLEAEAGEVQVRPHWQPRFDEPDAADESALGEELRGRLRESVRRRADVDRPGAFLSGGLDSSTVAGMLADVRPGEADTFSIGFHAEGYDELPYARIAAHHFGTRAHEYYVTPEDVVEAVPLIAASYDEPFGNSSALPAYFCARVAADQGVTRMLAGDGGDELFAGNARYAKQGVFEHWGRLPEAARRALEPLFTTLPRGLPVLGKARSYVEQARIPLPDRMQTYNYLHRLAVEDMLAPDFLAAIDRDAPWGLMRDIYHRPAEATSLNRMMYLDWQQTLADNDLRKVSRMVQLAGLDVAYPMLDDDLVEFSCRVPSTLKLQKGRLRHFYKEALSGFLPAEIIDKKKHGFGLPFGVWMHEHAPLREMAYDSLLRLKGQGFLRPAFIDELIRLHREGHSAYYGDFVWILMMLDLWLEAHPADSSVRLPRAAQA